MIDGKTVHVLILARAGSKRFPGKNLAILEGKPLIAHSIEHGLASDMVDRVFVFTESREIADISIKFNAEVPFLRPPELAQDSSTSEECVKRYLQMMKQNDIELSDILVILQPTSPLRLPEDINASLKLLLNTSARKVFSVCEFKKSVFWLRTINDKGFLNNFMDQFELPEQFDKNQSVYILNGAVYVYYTEDLLDSKPIDDKMIAAYVMPVEKSIDIDWEYEFKFAESLMKGLKID